MNPSKLRHELIADEGFRLLAYQDTLGFWTIGVGHFLGTEKRMVSISSEETYALLDLDIRTATEIANRLVPALPILEDARARALVEMAFNLGNKLENFTHMLQAIENEDWEAASNEALNSRWARQVGARAVRLAQMLKTGRDFTV